MSGDPVSSRRHAETSPVTGRRRRDRVPLRVRMIVAPVVLGAALLAGWFATVGLSHVPAYFLPSPGAVGRSLVNGLVVRGDLWPYIGTTFVEALLGCAAGIAVGIPLAVVIVRSRWVSSAVLPFLGATQAIPAIALAPLLALWIAYGLASVVVLCALMVFFPILVSTVVGLRHIDQEVKDAALIDGAGSWASLRFIEVPLALPNILAGVRNGFTLSVTGAVVGEMVMGGRGVGTLLTAQRERFDTAGMIASILVLAAIAAIIYSLVSLVERRWSLTVPKGEKRR